MDRLIPTPTSNEEAQLLTEVSRLATRAARRLANRELESPDEVDDLAQRCVLDCLMRLRTDRWRVHSTLEALVASMVWRKSAWGKRGHEHRGEQDAQHLAEREAQLPAWMDPELKCEERENAAIFEKALSELPVRCQAVFTLVRDGRMYVREVAAYFAISVGLVAADMRRAEHHLAARLLDLRARPVTPRSALRTTQRQLGTRSVGRETAAGGEEIAQCRSRHGPEARAHRDRATPHDAAARTQAARSRWHATDAT